LFCSPEAELVSSPYEGDPEEQAEVTERCKTQSSVKPAAKPTTAPEMETDRSDPSDTLAGQSAEPATLAVITDDR
jgi:hypothetical protein